MGTTALVRAMACIGKEFFPDIDDGLTLNFESGKKKLFSVSCFSVTITQHAVGTGVTKCQIVYTAQQSAVILAFLGLYEHFLTLVW